MSQPNFSDPFEWQDYIFGQGIDFEQFLSSQNETSPKKVRGLGKKTAVLRAHIMETIADVEKPITVRQGYYLCASRGFVPKTEEHGYKPVQRQLLLMRREGMIPYDWITDGSRYAVRPVLWSNLTQFLEHQQQTYRQDWWNEIPEHVEIWCEKDAIKGVLQPVTWDARVDLYPARGYSSESFAWESVQEIASTGKDTAYIYHIGDLDPSGWDASRDLQSKMVRFGDKEGITVNFDRLAINKPDIAEHNLITRPTKVSDRRAEAFFAEFGDGHPSVELEAMHPDTLRGIVRDAIRSHIPDHIKDKIRREEQGARHALEQFASAYGGGS